MIVEPSDKVKVTMPLGATLAATTLTSVVEDEETKETWSGAQVD
jgi:hypothetical protein